MTKGARARSSRKRRGLIRTGGCCAQMAQTQVEKELKLIRQRLESIEEVLAEEMTEDDKRALSEALKDHKSGKTVPFSARRN